MGFVFDSWGTLIEADRLVLWMLCGGKGWVDGVVTSLAVGRVVVEGLLGQARFGRLRQGVAVRWVLTLLLVLVMGLEGGLRG